MLRHEMPRERVHSRALLNTIIKCIVNDMLTFDSMLTLGPVEHILAIFGDSDESQNHIVHLFILLMLFMVLMLESNTLIASGIHIWCAMISKNVERN